MEPTEPATPGPASAPAPKPARPARPFPGRIAALLHTLRILFGHGRYLSEIAPERVGKPDFNAIAACFGTGRLRAILAHLERGLMRAAALERVLLERAMSGRDISWVGPGKRRCASPAEPRRPTEPSDPQGDPSADLSPDPSADPSADLSPDPSAEAQSARRPARRSSRPPHWDDPEMFMLTMEELVAQARRRPIGRLLVDICLDLAVVPRFCAGPFWYEVFQAIRAYGGRIEDLMKEKSNREVAFIKEQDRIPNSNWDWLDLKTRAGFRSVLGFFIGETPDPSDPSPARGAPAMGPATAMATGPP